jgi:hypothetical protein
MRYEINGKNRRNEMLNFYQAVTKPERVFQFLGDMELRKISKKLEVGKERQKYVFIFHF